MKSFGKLQVGDKIYYWDKGKLHEQIVHEANLETQVRKYQDWNGLVREEKREVFHLIAGKNGRTNVKLTWNIHDCHTCFGGMHRFACIEAAQKWIEIRCRTYQYKVNKLEYKVNKLENRLASRKRTLEALKNTLAMFK